MGAHDFHRISSAEELVHPHPTLSKGNSLLVVQDGKLIHDESVKRPRHNPFGVKHSWATPKHTHGPGKGKTLKPIYGDETYWDQNKKLEPKPPQHKPTVPKFRVPPRAGLHVPNTPKVPTLARYALQDTLYPRPPSDRSSKSGAQTAPRGAQTARLPTV